MMGPKHEAHELPDGAVMVSVTPPRFMKLPTQSILLSADQYKRYLRWRRNEGLIQELLHDLDDDQREILMTGIGPADFAKMFPAEDE